MYKGNMETFTSILDGYLRETYDIHLRFGMYDGGYYIALFHGNQSSADGYTVYDNEDFEQDIYDYVNEELKYLKHVQGEY